MNSTYRLALALLVGSAPLTYTPTTHADSAADAAIITSIIVAGAGLITWGWKAITESSKREQLAADKQSITDVKSLSPDTDLSSIISLLNRHNARAAIADYLLLKDTSIDEFNRDIAHYSKNITQKRALLQTNINHWLNKKSRYHLMRDAQNVYKQSAHKLHLIQNIDTFCKQHYAFMKLYQAYKQVKDTNYYNPHDTFQYIHAAEQMNRNYNRLQSLITPLNYQALDNGFQDLYDESVQELERLGAQRKRLVASNEYKHEVILREQVNQQEKTRAVLEETNRIKQQKAHAEERKARAQEEEVYELRKQNRIQNDANKLESERRRKEHIFAPEFREYENTICTLKHRVHELLKENTTIKNNLHKKKKTIYVLQQEIAALAQQLEDDEESEENKKLKQEVLALQQSINNPSYNPQSEAYAQWLTKKVSDLGKK